MEKTDVLVIGGSAAGIVAATTGKAFHKDKKVTLLRKEEKVLVPCGIPYIFGTLESSDQNVIPDAALTNAGVELKIGEAVYLDPENKMCKVDDGSEIKFEKVVMATGSEPAVPGWLKGADLENVFIIPKSKEYLDKFSQKLKQFKKIVILGGGFIGVEVADELNKVGMDVTVVEMLPHVLSLAFDPDIAAMAQAALEARGVHVRSNRLNSLNLLVAHEVRQDHAVGVGTYERSYQHGASDIRPNNLGFHPLLKPLHIGV